MNTDIDLTTADDMQTTNNSMKTMGPTGIGARLKTAREAMHLTEKDAAARLHLNPKFIDLMEKEDFSDGTPVTFIRGYMRSYARLVNVPESDIDAALQQLGMSQPPSTSLAPKLHTPTINNNNERYVRWITYLISAVSAVLVGIWWSTHTRETSANNKASAQPAVITPAITESTTQPVTVTPATTAATSATQPADATQTNAMAPAQVPQNSVPTTPAQPAAPVAAVPASPQADTTMNQSVAATPPVASQPAETTPAAAATAVPVTPAPIAQPAEANAPAPAPKTEANDEDQPETTKPVHRHQAKSSDDEDPHSKMVITEPGLDTSDN
ncbi:MAG: helix-turn-helix domain-containing protein [Gammaproteobacteria bacterium]